MDGWLHGLRICSVRRVCRRQGFGSALPARDRHPRYEPSSCTANGLYYLTSSSYKFIFDLITNNYLEKKNLANLAIIIVRLHRE